MKRLRISAISYLNTAPLMWDFEPRDVDSRARSDFDISYTLPSQCAASLREGSADIGIIPAAAYTSVPDLAILPGVAIGYFVNDLGGADQSSVRKMVGRR